jgi:hypothetical protein
LNIIDSPAVAAIDRLADRLLHWAGADVAVDVPVPHSFGKLQK